VDRSYLGTPITRPDKLGRWSRLSGFKSGAWNVRCFAKGGQRPPLVVSYVLTMRSVVVLFQLNLGTETSFAKET
jgi:hypothetical protein